MPTDKDKSATSAALDAAIQHNADVVRRGRRKRPFLERLGLSLPVTPDDVRRAYLEKAKQAHPDHGGDSQQFQALQQAFDEALQFAQRNGKRLPWIGIQVPIYIAQRNVVQMVESWGGEVEVLHLDWLEDTVGEDFTAIADRLVEINLSGCDIGDSELLALADEPDGLQYLEVLRVADTKVGDAAVRRVTAQSNIRYLDVRRTAVTRATQRQLAKLPQMSRVVGSYTWRERVQQWVPWW